MPIDWGATHRRAIACLRQELYPIQYRMLYEQAVVGHPSDYSPKTDAAEKFRQRYAERNHRPIILVPGGTLALDYWFPYNHQPHLSILYPSLRIAANGIIAYEIGYEFAQRENNMMDHFHDADTSQRHRRRRLGFLFEAHVRHYYYTHWPDFYVPPSNEGQYDKPAKDDFSLKLPGLTPLPVDTKTESFEEDGEGWAMIRNVTDPMIYIQGVWDEGRNCAIVKGIVSGRWLRSIAGLRSRDFVSEGQLMSYEVLSVMLNMAKRGLDYVAAFRQVSERVPALRVAI